MNQRRRFDWSWSGAVALVLAIFVGAGWSTALVLAISSRSPPVNDNVTSLLTAVGGVLAGGVVTYLGATIADRNKRPPPDAPDGDPDVGD